MKAALAALAALLWASSSARAAPAAPSLPADLEAADRVVVAVLTDVKLESSAESSGRRDRARITVQVEEAWVGPSAPAVITTTCSAADVARADHTPGKRYLLVLQNGACLQRMLISENGTVQRVHLPPRMAPIHRDLLRPLTRGLRAHLTSTASLGVDARVRAALTIKDDAVRAVALQHAASAAGPEIAPDVAAFLGEVPLEAGSFAAACGVLAAKWPEHLADAFAAVGDDEARRVAVLRCAADIPPDRSGAIASLWRVAGDDDALAVRRTAATAVVRADVALAPELAAALLGVVAHDDLDDAEVRIRAADGLLRRDDRRGYEVLAAATAGAACASDAECEALATHLRELLGGPATDAQAVAHEWGLVGELVRWDRARARPTLDPAR